MNIINKKYGKSMKIISILSEFKDLSSSKILDVGCGKGLIAKNLSKYCKEIISIDVEDKRLDREGYKFELVKDERLPFKDNSFDVIISNQVIEHVNNQDVHIYEIHRVLKKYGICYLATPNKYWPIEPHYYLPFLGMLPNKISNFYLRIFWNKDYDVKLLSYNQLTNKLKKLFVIKDFTFRVIKNHKKYHLDKKYNIIPKFLIGFLNKNVLPSFIFVLEKK